MSSEKFLESRWVDKLDVSCDICNSFFKRTKRNIIKGRDRHGKDLCLSCVAKACLASKPQCNKDFWSSEEKKNRHRTIIKNSAAHQKSRAIVAEKLKGSLNPMFGKKHKADTIVKMSASRIGKTGENATAWKGGKESLMRKIKRTLQQKHKWFSRVFDRDGAICQHCGGIGKDAHHIHPLKLIVNELLNTRTFQDENEKFAWLIEQPKVLDVELLNGICLCRECHKKAHQNWGSHNPVTTKE